jgi:hypothetical protein
MIDLALINGTFTLGEAEALLTALVKVKIAFHESKIGITHENEEDMKHSETRVKNLEQNLRIALKKMKESGKERFDIGAHIAIAG